MNGRDFLIALVVVLVVAGIGLSLLGGTARAQMREIARRTGDVPASEPT